MDHPAGEMQAALLKWFAHHGRDLPFRRTRNPYAVWVSEVMLQQTTVPAATPYWRRFLERFPTVEALAEAPVDDVLHAWAGLGYYSRARNLHRAARQIVRQHAGRFPDRYEDVLALPGVGRYTAGAVCSFSYNADVPAVDANATRVLSRWFAIGGDPRTPATHRALWRAAEEALPKGHARDWNLALFDLGAALCTPAQPQCARCPVSAWCEAHRQGRPGDFPQTPPRAALERRTDVAAVIRDGHGRLLMRRRPVEGIWAGMWEMPSGPLAPGEDEGTGAARVARERAGVEVAAGSLLGTVRHTVLRRSISLRAYAASVTGGEMLNTCRWVPPEETTRLALPSPMRRLVALVSAGP